jgi:hypothetical protein
MLITKKIERLYSLKEYENVKLVIEATVEIGDKNPNEELEKLSTILWEDIKKEKEKIKPSKKKD